VLYYCPTHKSWEALTEQTLADESLCEFCCFHKPCPMGHSDEYWEEGWDEFAADYGDEKKEGYREKWQSRTRDNQNVVKDEDVLIIDYLDLT